MQRVFNAKKDVVIVGVFVIVFVMLSLGVVAINGANKDKKESENNIDTKYEYQSDYAKAIGNFTAEATVKLIDDKSNTCYSPISLYAALALVSEVSGGEAKAELLDVLGVKSSDELAENFNKYNKLFEEMSERPDSEVRLNNSIWLQDKYTLKDSADEVLESCKNDFFASVYNKNFIYEDINKWVEENTNGLIKEIYTSDEILEAVIVNTLYYNSNWRVDFNSSGEDKFTLTSGDTVNAEYMNTYIRNNGVCLRDKNYTAVKIPSYCGDMYFVCPNEGKELDDLLSEEVINNIIASTTSEEAKTPAVIKLEVPKFSYEYSLNENTLVEAFKSMGLSDKKNLGQWTELNDSLGEQLVSISQATKISIDEEGIEAASVVDIPLSLSSADDVEKIDLTLDRPFMYIIMYDDIPLFIGTVYNPTE